MLFLIMLRTTSIPAPLGFFSLPYSAEEVLGSRLCSEHIISSKKSERMLSFRIDCCFYLSYRHFLLVVHLFCSISDTKSHWIVDFTLIEQIFYSCTVYIYIYIYFKHSRFVIACQLSYSSLWISGNTHFVSDFVNFVVKLDSCKLEKTKTNPWFGTWFGWFGTRDSDFREKACFKTLTS